MFSPDVSESSRLVELTFIAGVPDEELKSASKELLRYHNSPLKPEILFSFPDSKGIIYNSVLDFVFPTKIHILYTEEKPKFYSIVLTNEQGMRTFCYIMKIYEKINISKLFEGLNEKHSKVSFKSEAAKTDEIDDYNEEESKLSISFQNRSIYVPYAICIWSTVPKVEFFKGVMLEFYRIITFDNHYKKKEAIDNYRFCELLHTMIFLSNIIKPPSMTKMKVNLRFSSLDLITSSVYQIPHCGDHLKNLFETLEISSIIKLWCSLLSEKHIIIIANQNLLLYSIVEALINLTFPFKWLHTYIPVLPQDQLDYLESPTPYIMGVLSSYTDIEYLKEAFPNHIICDVNTSMVYGTSYCNLPIKEESKIRKKIQYAKNPHIYNIEDIDENESKNERDFPSIEDVDFSRSFSENMQYVFFRVFRNSLYNLKDKYIKDGVFEAQKFLDDIYDTSLKDFWDKIINTAAFEYFILNFQYLDDSLTNIFTNICENETKDNIEFFNFNMTLPNTVNLILKQNGINNHIQNKQIDTLITDYDKIITYITTQASLVNIENDKFITTFNILPSPVTSGYRTIRSAASIKKKEPKKKRQNNFSCDFVNLTNNRKYSKFHLSTPQEIDIQPRRVSFLDINKLNATSNFYSTTNSITPIINVKTRSVLSIYGEEGFINFANEIIANPDESGYQSEILKYFNKHINSHYHHIQLVEDDIIEREDEYNELEYYSEDDSVRTSSSKILNIFEIPKQDCFQYYLLISFYLDEYSNSNEPILDNFIKAYLCDENSFPRIRFLQFLTNLKKNEMKNILKEIDVDNRLPLIKKIIQFRLKSLDSNKTKKDQMNLSKKSRKIPNTENVPKSRFFEHKSDLGSDSKYSVTNTIICHTEGDENKVSTTPFQIYEFEEKEKEIKFKSSRFASSKTLQLKPVVQRRSSVHLNGFSRSSFYGDIYDNKADANKIIESLRVVDSKENLIVKKYLINSSSGNVGKSKVKDPLGLAEDISIKLYTLILKNSLNKFKSEMIVPNLLASITASDDFILIKSLIEDLKYVKLSNLSNETLKTCFWLNMYNFLCIYTIIYKRQVSSNYYEWYCFLKNSYYDIGGYEISLYEIENCILKHKVFCLNNYGAVPFFGDEDTRKVLMIHNVHEYIKYGMYLPTNSGPGLNIYFPNNLIELLKYNAIDFFTKNIKIEIEKYTIFVPEYIYWIDKNFINNIFEYKELLSTEYAEFISTKKNILEPSIVKYVWFINFSNIG